MNILWVKAGGLLPLDTGGKIRSYQILKQLAANNPVTLFTFYPEHADDQHFRLKEILDDVICCPLPIPPVARGLKDRVGYVANLLTAQPYSLSKYSRSANAKKLST